MKGKMIFHPLMLVIVGTNNCDPGKEVQHRTWLAIELDSLLAQPVDIPYTSDLPPPI